MPIRDRYYVSYIEFDVVRSHTLQDGYVPIKSEALGIWNLLSGATHCLSALLSPHFPENRRLEIIAKCQLADGCINIFFSPITWFALGVLATSIYYRSTSVPPTLTLRAKNSSKPKDSCNDN